jgi:mRNA interferase MazF
MIKNLFLTLLDWWRVSTLLWDKNPSVVFKEGEIWWASIGMNIGVEIFGKGHEFARPVIVFRKFNKDSFLGIPLTTKEKEGEWYLPVFHNKIKRIAILSQVRTLDSRRLLRKVGSFNDIELQAIRDKFRIMYCSFENLHPADVVGCGGKSQ